MTSYLIDTDVLIDHLRGATTWRLPPDTGASYSVVTLTELLAGRRADRGAISALLGTMVAVAVDESIATVAGTIRRDHDLQIADAIIAATAIVTGSALVTRNRGHFERVADLTVVSPDEPA